MALWLVAVIVLIAVGAMPSGAQAHEGHRHPGGARVVQGAVETPAPVLFTPLLSAPVLSVAKATTPPTGLRVPARLGIASACDGLCCGGACQGGPSCCTGTGLAVESATSVPPRRPGEPALARPLPARTDVVPEALPEPPRSFA